MNRDLPHPSPLRVDTFSRKREKASMRRSD